MDFNTQADCALDSFLNRWSLNKIKELTLQEYVGLNNKDTFCQWVETKAKILGSINGMPSIKFGIYLRRDPKKKPKNYSNDENYSWVKGYGSNKEEAFENIKADLIKIIEYSERGKFNKIDNILLPNLFKWKVAFIYSNKRLIPIYKKDILHRIANYYGKKTSRKTQISEIQELLISQKHPNKSVYDCMIEWFWKFKEKSSSSKSNQVKKGRKRKGTKNRDTKPQFRSGNKSYITEQKHNKIQETLKNILENKYGSENVILEEDYVDIKVFQPEYISFYEVKSAPYASDCVREALGQLLLYVNNDIDSRIKKLYVAGQYPPNEYDQEYIEFIKENLSTGQKPYFFK